MALTKYQSLSIVTAPTSFPVSTDEVKAQCRVDTDDEILLIDRLIKAATSYVDGYGVLGRAIITQTWGQSLQNPGSKVHLLMHPVQSLMAVKYYDTANTLQTATLANFQLINGDNWAYVEPVSGETWPTAYDRPDAVRVEFKAGFGDAATDVPQGIRHALLLLICHWFENREDVARGSLAHIPIGVSDLLNAERTAWYG